MATVKPNQTSKGGNDSIPAPPPPPARPEFTRSHGSNRVLKSGPLFISSKGIGWTSWKKRWFILTRNSLVFFRSDPNAIPQKGAEVNLTLGGIDLNNSGSVVVKADKKLLTVLFPDGRDGRAFTLKAETSEDLYEWKTALENALAQAPSSHMMGQNGILKSDQADEADTEQAKDNQRLKYLVIGRPVLLALEDVDGSPSFLEKALRFIEDHGFKVEGILRQAADVEDVERRIREYEQGKTEFSAEEDGHIIADCVKYFLRELPSSPVPASCCSALLEACRTDRGSRVNAMRVAICETFPEPNRRLLQRILLMMQHVASHRSENRMSTSAVAACMAPLLLRPLMAGECEIDTSVNVGDGSIQHAPLLLRPRLAGESEIDTSVNVGDGSIQLLKAAAAANHAQAIVTTLLEEYDNIFREGSMTPGLYSDSDDYDSEDEEVTDDDDYEDDEQDYSTEGSDAGSDAYTDDDLQNGSSETCTESSDSGKSSLSDTKGSDGLSSSLKSPEVDNDLKVEQKLSSSPVNTSLPVHDDVKRHENFPDESNISLEAQEDEPDEDDVFEKTELENKLTGHATPACMQKSSTISNGPTHRRAHMWGRTSARKNLSMETIDFPAEEFEIQKLEACKIELQNKISEEVEFNATLQIQLEKRKMDLRERRLALEQDLQRLQEQLQKERDKRALLESILDVSQSPLSDSAISDEEMKEDLKEILQSEADVANLTQSVNDLGAQLDQRHVQTSDSALDSSNQPRHASSRRTKRKDKQSDVAAAPTSQLGRSSSKDTRANITESEIETKYETTSAQRRHPHENPQLDRDWSSNSRSCADRTESEIEKKYESTSSQQKHLHKNPQLDPARSSNSRSSASADPKKSGTRSEERRSQIASELQNLDKGWGHNALTTPDKSSGSEMGQSQQSTVEGQSSEVESVQNRKSARGSEGSQSMPNLDKGKGSKSSSRQKPGKSSSRQNSGKK